MTNDFEGVTVLCTTCLECEHTTERKETFCDICVPIMTAGQDSDEGNPVDLSPVVFTYLQPRVNSCETRKECLCLCYVMLSAPQFFVII